MTLDALLPRCDRAAGSLVCRPGWQVRTRFHAWHITLGDQPPLRELAAQ